MKSALSKNKVHIRLEDERWIHIVESHNEVAGMRDLILETIISPEKIIEGWEGELLAIRMIEIDKALIVVYREINGHDGFIITAYITKRLLWLNKRSIIWQKHH